MEKGAVSCFFLAIFIFHVIISLSENLYHIFYLEFYFFCLSQAYLSE